MQWQNISGSTNMSTAFIEEVMKMARKYPGKYRIKLGKSGKKSEREYVVRVWSNGEEVRVLVVENEDGEIRVKGVNKSGWSAEEALYMAMNGEADRVEIITN